MIATHQERGLRSDTGTVLSPETLLKFVEWSQGGIPLELAIQIIVEGIGAECAALTRVNAARATARVAAATAGANGRRNPMAETPCAHAVLGAEIATLKEGTSLLLSEWETSRIERDKDLEARMLRYGFVEVGFVYLGREGRVHDFLELYFIRTPEWDSVRDWLAQGLARIYRFRRPGLLTESCARQGAVERDGRLDDAPILGMSNPCNLTRAEWRVCVLVSRGLTAKAVAGEMEISVATVRTHLRRIYPKTGFTGYHELARRLVSVREQRALHSGAGEAAAA